ncbi:trans-sialidase [Trypanosoma cruzi cruzi]|nr:trans-sialidase [Trypanosoma cruzi cruzi]PBJ77369.1 trans-sialidase [Trypanosoma cruzi cruzi]
MLCSGVNADNERTHIHTILAAAALGMREPATLFFVVMRAWQGGVQLVSRASLRVPGMSVYCFQAATSADVSFLLWICRWGFTGCTARWGKTQQQNDWRQRVCTVKGGRALLHPAGFFLCGRRSVCADAWQKRPPWLLLVVVAIAVCSRCIVPPSLFMCLCT